MLWILLILSAVSAFGQITWTHSACINGASSSPTCQIGDSGGFLPGTNYFTAVYDAVSGRSLYYTSSNGSIYSNAIYAYSAVSDTIIHGVTPITSGTTSEVCNSDTSNFPSDRHPLGQAIDTHRNVMWISGGVCGGVEPNDTYYLSLNSNATMNAWTKYLSTTPGNATGMTKSGGQLGYDPDDDALVYIGYDGGASTKIYHMCPLLGNPGGTLRPVQTVACSAGDTWELKVTLSSGSTTFGSKFSTMVWDASVSQFMRFGGYTDTTIWVPTTNLYKPSTRAITQQFPSSHPGENRNQNGCGADYAVQDMAYVGPKGLVYLHDSQAIPPADWVYNSTIGQWTMLGNFGGSTCTSEMTYDAAKNALVTWDTKGSATTIQIGQLSSGGLSVPITIAEALFPGDMTGHTNTPGSGGIARANEPFTVGVPIADSAAENSTAVFGLTGATAGQFRVLECWEGTPTGTPATSCSSGGHIRILEVSGILASLSAGTTATVTLTDSGSGNFGGSNLATDGTPIIVSTNGGTCGSGSAICFEVKKANHDGIDRVRIGSTTVVTAGTSDGIVVTGPSVFSYPDDVTCSVDGSNHPGVNSLCTTDYKSSNDASSTCTIEENGPVKAILRCDGDLIDGASHTYMHHTTRYTFYQGRAQVKIVPILRNADYGTNNTFASAFKGHQGFEFRNKLNISSGNFTIAKDSGTQTGSLSGSQSVYIYQGIALNMQNATTCTGNQSCLPLTPDNGWTIVSSASGTLATGTNTQFPTGYANIDSSGIGAEFGLYEMAAVGSKSLELRSGGSEIRLGLLATENSIPYYQVWPQYNIQEGWISYHTSAPSSLSNDFLAYQAYLIGSPTFTYWNSTHHLPWPMTDPAVEDAWYISTGVAANPSQSVSEYCQASAPPCLLDKGTLTAPSPQIQIYPWWAWSAGGAGTQADYRMSGLLNFITRGITGRFLDAAHFYRYQEIAQSYPQSNYGAPSGSYTWRSKPYSGQAGEALDGAGFPLWTSVNSPTGIPLALTVTAVSNTTPIVVTATNANYLKVGQVVKLSGTGLSCVDSAGPNFADGYWLVSASNSTTLTLGSSIGCGTASSGTVTILPVARHWIEEGLEHSHGYGIINFYEMTGDEAMKDVIMSGMKDIYTNPNTYAAANSPPSFLSAVGTTNSRATGVYFMNTARLYNFLTSLSDADAAQTLANGVSDYASNVKPDMCVPGTWPAGCSLFQTDPDGSMNPSRGVNRKRGVRWGAGSENPYTPVCGTTPSPARAVAPYYTAILIQGLLELRAAKGASWNDYWLALDLAYGMTQGVFGEDYYNNGTGRWDQVGFLGDLFGPSAPGGFWSIDGPNGCAGTTLTTQATIWTLFAPLYMTEGANLNWQPKMKILWQKLFDASGATGTSDYGGYQTNFVVGYINTPGDKTLQTLTISSFVNNGAGSYTIGWTTPANTDYLRVKYAPNTIVDWIGFNAGTNAFIGSPSTTTNWFAAINATGIPAPVAGSQSMTITGLSNGLVSADFSVKAMAPGNTSACPTDSKGWVITGLSMAQDNLLGPLTCYGINPWTFGDLANKGTVDYMVPIALAEAPVLGTVLPGTFSFTSGSDTLTTTADQTGLTGYITCAWTSVDGAGTGRMIVPIASVTPTTVVGQEHFQEPSFSGVSCYRMSQVPDSHGCDFTCWTVENPSQSWNYYDVSIALYRLYYRTGTTQYQTWARQFADIQWQWVLDHGYRTVSPRAGAFVSQFFRAGESHPERLPGLYNWLTIIVPLWATNADLRESGYTFWDIALGAKVDTDATRHTQYCSWLSTYTPHWTSTQNADGSWSENEFALNTSYVSAPKSFTPPFQYESFPWKAAINIKSLEAAYESLNDTTSQGCNNQALATATLGSVAKAVTWQNNFGRSTANRGVYYEVNSQSNDQASVSPATGTVSATLTSTAIIGVGTNWNTAGYCDGTHFIGFFTPRTTYKIASCTSNTAATLSVPFGLYGEVSNVSGDQFGVAPAASTSCNSSATYCFTGTGDRNLTRTNCGGIGWLYSITLNAAYRSWADECYSASLGGPTAGLTSAANLNSITLPCSGSACDGLVTDTVSSAENCNDTTPVNTPPCLFGVSFGNLGKNYGEAFGAPGIDNEIAWRLLGSQPQPVAPSITSASPLPGGTVGNAYSFQFAASGTVPITWTGTGLPSWASLSSSGTLTGTPDAAATSNLSITATNVAGANNKAFSLTTVNPNIAPTITSTNPLPSGATSIPYSYQFTANGTAPITWSGTSLPAWSSLSAAGALTGTPNVAAISIVNITATNSTGSAGPTPFSLTITQTPPVATCSPKTGVTPPNVLDIQFQTNMALGIVACTNSLTGNGCTVVDVQRIINAALGQACHIGP